MLERMYRDAERRKGVRDRIRDLWEKSGYTEEHVADYLGISISGFQKQKQTGGITREHGEKLAELFGTTYDYIANGKETKGATPDAMGALRGDLKPEELRNRLDQIEGGIAAIRKQLDALAEQSDVQQAATAATLADLESAVRSLESAPARRSRSKKRATGG